MAGSPRRCSDEELQRALSDIDELVARRGPVPDEFRFPGLEEEQKNSEKEEGKVDDDEKKKKLHVLSPKDVQMVLSYECEEFPGIEMLTQLAEEKGGEYEDLKTAVSSLHVFGKHYQDGIRATQEMMRHQLLTQGHVTYEATDDQAQLLTEGLEQVMGQSCSTDDGTDDGTGEEKVAQQGARGSGGRRRHRPGVTKTAGGSVRKMN